MGIPTWTQNQKLTKLTHRKDSSFKSTQVKTSVYTCEVAYADLGEAALNYLGEVGIRAKLRPLANSLLLAAVAMAFWLLVGIPSGILAAVRVGRFWDSAGKLFALLGLSRHRVACHSPDRWRLFDDRRPLPAGSHPTLAARQRKLRDASASA